MVELHGSFSRQVCLACGRRWDARREEFLEDLDRAVAGLRSAFVPSLASLLPRCTACGAPARPDFVAFGEAVQGYREAEDLASGCRTLLVVGTSGEVFPASRLPEEARAAGGFVIEVAPGLTFVDADLRLTGEAGTTLPGVVELALRSPD